MEFDPLSPLSKNDGARPPPSPPAPIVIVYDVPGVTGCPVPVNRPPAPPPPE
jgi:hypothetical protein